MFKTKQVGVCKWDYHCGAGSAMSPKCDCS